MTRDASLDDFLDDAGDEESGVAGAGRDGTDGTGGNDAGAPGDPTDGGGDRGETAAGTVDPARVTYDWSPTGAACDECGATVERRWRDGASMACAECKEW